MNNREVISEYLLKKIPDLKNKAAYLEKTFDWCDYNRVGILLPHDFPPQLNQIYSPPPYLFYKGNPELLFKKSLAIVGARKASPYGLACAFHFAREIAAQNWVVVSGLAKGVDGYSHRGALSVEGQTVSVFGSGFKTIYPNENRNLAGDILEKGGTWISEYFPDMPPLARNFPARNRIISGLSWGTLVIEAKHRSGSLITALNALDQGKEVFVIPGQIDQSEFEGSHQLIQQGAKLVFRVKDVLEDWKGPVSDSPKKTFPFSFGEEISLQCWRNNHPGKDFSDLQEALNHGEMVQTAPQRFLSVSKDPDEELAKRDFFQNN